MVHLMLITHVVWKEKKIKKIILRGKKTVGMTTLMEEEVMKDKLMDGKVNLDKLNPM